MSKWIVVDVGNNDPPTQTAYGPFDSEEAAREYLMDKLIYPNYDSPDEQEEELENYIVVVELKPPV